LNWAAPRRPQSDSFRPIPVAAYLPRRYVCALFDKAPQTGFNATGAAAPIRCEGLVGSTPSFDPVFGMLKTNRVDAIWVHLGVGTRQSFAKGLCAALRFEGRKDRKIGTTRSAQGRNA
jgi:hypothetical protein